MIGIRPHCEHQGFRRTLASASLRPALPGRPALSAVPSFWVAAVLWLSVCVGLVFLATLVHELLCRRGGPEGGKEGGCGGNLGGTLEAVGKGCPRGGPPPEMGRPQAVLFRGGWSGGFGGGTRQT
jgi:hypothetical protein